ncbi:hypothetical protein HYC85_003133 [Camellia sinensis]|uniref:Amidase domain-containing protein n=1 Tax=Camellia sinensis TaxID=4442 RepID=A0A7J7IBX1_CAMSI|nr:hypothetical protein HYC85_003133 [Camellia sinensis]
MFVDWNLNCNFYHVGHGRPICRTVSDSVYVLDAIVGFDPHDAVATRKASKYILHGGYVQFLKANGLRGKRQRGATLAQGLDIPNFDAAEFKLSLNAYLKELLAYPVRSLADAIAFNKKFSDLEKIDEYGQDLFFKAEKTIGMVLAIGGFPGISVPAGYDHDERPFGICFGGLKGFEPKLIEITLFVVVDFFDIKDSCPLSTLSRIPVLPQNTSAVPQISRQT